VATLHIFWHEYATQKKAQRWAYLQSAVAAMAGGLGLKTATIVAKTIEVLDSLVFAGANFCSEDERGALEGTCAQTPHGRRGDRQFLACEHDHGVLERKERTNSSNNPLTVVA
jgi:hypothetical protein